MTRTTSWRLDHTTTEAPSMPASPSRPSDHDDNQAAPTAFASLQYLRAALRRRRRTWVTLALAGLIAGGGYAVAVPATPVASVVLTLGHTDGQDPSTAMQTDLNLLRTNVVTDRAAHELGLDPRAFGADVSGMILTPDLLRVRVTGPTDEAAVKRAAVVADVFLKRRGETLRLESDNWVRSYQSQIDDLRNQIATFQSRYNALSNGDASAREQATSVLQQRDSDQEQVAQLQGKIDDTRQSISAVLAASTAVDPAAIVPVSAPKRAVLTAATGLVGGGFLGVGIVVVQALTTTRLRRREEVALALAAPVLYAAGRAPRLRRKPDDTAVPALARGVVDTLARPDTGRLLLLVSLAGDRRAEQRLARVARTAAAALAEAGRRVLVVDLTQHGGLDALDVSGLRVVRPTGLLARGPLDSGPTGETAPEGWRDADVVLTVGHVGLDAGVDELASWGDRALLLVRAGQASAERLRSTAELLRVAGVHLVGALLDGTDATDESMGRPDLAVPEARRADHGRPPTGPDESDLAGAASSDADREPAAVEAT